MQEIKCPSCGKLFEPDYSGYSEIVKQVRDQEFQKQLAEGINSQVELAKSQKDLEMTKLKAEYDKKHAEELKLKDVEIESILEYKAKRSTKMVGEELERHCENEFNSLRATGFKGAYFEKDSDVRSGSKGDYIFRDFDKDTNEYISIMFEMKTESDQTATKKKNEDFFKELDKDRNEKKCEYAVLISTLEWDNDAYNGITDVSHRYEKMYVVRPEFFIPIITLLRNAAENSLDLRAELVLAQSQNLEITNFRNTVSEYAKSFGDNVGRTQQKSDEVIDQIDKAISSLEKTKKALQDTTKYLGRANNNLEDLMNIALPESKPKEIKG